MQVGCNEILNPLYYGMHYVLTMKLFFKFLLHEIASIIQIKTDRGVVLREKLHMATLYHNGKWSKKVG